MRRLTELFRRRPRRTLQLPGQGRAVVASDFHGNLNDWRAFLATSRILERLEAGEDVYLLLAGDIPDVIRHQSIEPSVPDDGDVQILDELIEARAALGERGCRIVYLEGNHDFHVARIVREIAAFYARQRGTPVAGPDEHPRITPEEYGEYCAHYLRAYGERIYENNLVPYDMVRRVEPRHLRFIESGPILVHLEGARVLVVHAGPPRMNGMAARHVRKQLERADRRDLLEAEPERYYASLYHQVLNNRFRNGDYALRDLEGFLEAYGAASLISGHTPHPYLIDLEQRTPLEHCGFERGVGLIGERQVILCTSFGALHPSWKSYVELDLARPYASAAELCGAEAEAVQPIYARGEWRQRRTLALPGAEIIVGEA